MLHEGEPPAASYPDASLLAVSVVVPVYNGELTLEPLLAEIEPLVEVRRTPEGHPFHVSEVLLVHDGAGDHSDQAMQRLKDRYSFVRLIWLSRNFGQHPATLAGMASSRASWVATLDEDGQQDPGEIAALLDVAVANSAQLVYANPRNTSPHGSLRNAFSRMAKWAFLRVLGNASLGEFNSFRLIDGEIARGLAAYCGPGVYLDVALSWVVSKSHHCAVTVSKGVKGRFWI